MIINENEFKSQLAKVFKLCGVASLLNAEKSDKFYRLTVRMLEENEKYNLTAITDVNKIILNLFSGIRTYLLYLQCRVALFAQSYY